MRKIGFIKVFYVLFALLSMNSCGGCHFEDDDHDHDHDKDEEHEHTNGEVHLDEEEFRRVRFEVVKRDTFSELFRTTGEITPTRLGESVITASFDGIVNICTDISLGKMVTKNQQVFVISTGVGREADIVQQAAVEMEALRREYERDLLLAKDNIVSQRELNECKERYMQAQIKHNNLASKISFGKSVVKSPIAGFIKSIYVVNGSYVTAGDRLAVISQSESLILKIKFPQKFLSKLQMVKDVNFYTPYEDELYCVSKMNGKKLSEGSLSSSGTYYVPMYYEFKNVSNIVPGTIVECIVKCEDKPNVISVPNEALFEDEGVRGVFVKVSCEALKKKYVTVGQSDGERTEILSGLREGEQVAISNVKRIYLATSAKAIPAHSHSH